MDAEVYTIKEFAELIKVHESTVRREVHSGKIKAFKVGNTYRIPRKEFERMIDDTDQIIF